MRRNPIPLVLGAVWLATACQPATPPPAPPSIVQGPPAVPDAQPAVNAPLFVGQAAFADPLAAQVDYTPTLTSARVDGANSGVVDGSAPLGSAPVTGSAALALQAPLLWGHGGLTAGCQTPAAGGSRVACLEAVNSATMTVEARWAPAGQDLNVATAVLDGQGRILVTSRQNHLFVVTRPAAANGAFQVVRDVDLNPQLGNQQLGSAIADADGDLWFFTATPAAAVPAPVGATVGYVTQSGQVVATTLAGQVVATAPAVDGENVYLATSPSAAAAAESPGGTAADEGEVYDLTAAGQVQLVWHEPYDAGTSVKPGATIRGTSSPVLLLGSQFLAVTDNADSQEHLLVFLRHQLLPSPSTTGSAPTTRATTGAAAAATATTATTAAPGSTSGATDPRLLCRVPLFGAGASAVTVAPIAYSSSAADSVIVANGYGTPAPPASAQDNSAANDLDPMPGGLSRIDVAPDGSECRSVWTAPVRFEAPPVMATSTGLVYGYTEDPERAAVGTYVWYFAGIDYRSGNVLWEQRAGAGSTKNNDGLPSVVDDGGVLYQLLPLGLEWMHDVSPNP